jgi:homoserine O-acetyltransferase
MFLIGGKGFFGERDYFNPDEHFVICANILGSPYGTVSPLSINPTTGQPYYLSFPEFTIRDMVKAHKLLADHLEIEYIEILLLGGSLGGQQALEWSIIEPARIKNLILIATNAKHSPWGIAFNESQRLAITADRTFYQHARWWQQRIAGCAQHSPPYPTAGIKPTILPSRKRIAPIPITLKHRATRLIRVKNW